MSAQAIGVNAMARAELSSRRRQWRAIIKDRPWSARQLPGLLQVTLSKVGDVEARVRSLVAAEGRDCSFGTWVVDAPAGQPGVLIVTVRARAGRDADLADLVEELRELTMVGPRRRSR